MREVAAIGKPVQTRIGKRTHRACGLRWEADEVAPTPADHDAARGGCGAFLRRPVYELREQRIERWGAGKRAQFGECNIGWDRPRMRGELREENGTQHGVTGKERQPRLKRADELDRKRHALPEKADLPA